MLARTTLQVETLRAIIEDCSDEDEAHSENPVDLQHYHNVQVGFSVASSADTPESVSVQPDVIPQCISDDAVSAANDRELEIISALDSCVQEMAGLDPQEKLVHCATVLQVSSSASIPHCSVSQCNILMPHNAFVAELLGSSHIRHTVVVCEARRPVAGGWPRSHYCRCHA
jgi:hypothetical protein